MLMRFVVELSDIDRSVYDFLDFRIARHPSETDIYLVARVIAYAFTFDEDTKIGPGLCVPDEPALSRTSPDGRLLEWIDIGTPSEDRLTKSWKQAEKVWIFPHRGWGSFDPSLSGVAGRNVEVIYAEPRFYEELAAKVDKQNRWVVTISDGSIFVSIGEEHVSTEFTRHTA